MTNYKALPKPELLLLVLLATHLIGMLMLQSSVVANNIPTHDDDDDDNDDNDQDDDDVFYDFDDDYDQVEYDPSKLGVKFGSAPAPIKGGADEDSDDVFYDVEDEISFDEDAEENVCAMTSRSECLDCCQNQGFELPLWDSSIGQCLCYLSHGEENICKKSNQSWKACHTCCKANNFKQSDFPDNSWLTSGKQACYCSEADYELFLATVGVYLRKSRPTTIESSKVHQ